MAGSPTTDKAITEYYSNILHPKILQELKANPKLKWASFTLLNNGNAHVEHIGASNPENQEWKTFNTRLQPVLKKAPTPVGVKIAKEKIDLLTGGDDVIVHDLPIYPYALGRSCNLKDSPKGYGTLGGYLKVTGSDGKEEIYGLTNNHVVNIDPKTENQDPDSAKVYHGNKIITPSQGEFEKIKAYKNTMETYEKKKETAKKTHQNLKTPKDSWTMPEKPWDIGELKHASGRRVATMPATPGKPDRHVILDWALIKTDLETYEREKKKYGKDFQVNSTPHFDYYLIGMNMTIPPDLQDEKFKDIDPSKGRLRTGMTVYKFGWTTGWTTAETLEKLETLNIENAELFKGGKIQRPAGVNYTEEFVAFSNKAPFCKEGDSGSWVFDENARLVGILWGQGSDRVFITDIHTVLDDIKAKEEFKGKKIEILVG